ARKRCSRSKSKVGVVLPCCDRCRPDEQETKRQSSFHWWEVNGWKDCIPGCCGCVRESRASRETNRWPRLSWLSVTSAGQSGEVASGASVADQNADVVYSGHPRLSGRE